MMSTYRGRDSRTLHHLEVEVADGVIKAVRPTDEDGSDVWMAPGLVDLQVNGYRGVDLNGDGCSAAEVLQLTRSLAAVGTTTYLPTIITAPFEAMCARLEDLARARNGSKEIEHAVPCIHMEGPYLSPVDGYRGAHPQDVVRAPSTVEFDALQVAAKGLIGLVTLSPHWPGSASFIEDLCRRNVVVAIGHTHATPEQITQAVDAGARLSTHLGNGIAAQLPRHPNAIWTQLADDRLTASLIGDGLHLPGDTLRVMLRAKGFERAVLVSDAVALAGCLPGEYQQHIGGSVVVREDGSIRMPATGLLAGSSIALHQAVARLVSLTGCSLGDAVRMATKNPAGLMGLSRGHLQVGRAADIILFRCRKEDNELQIVDVIVRGKSATGA